MSERDNVRWTASNPYKHEVVLLQETYDGHLIDDHGKLDASGRIAIEPYIKPIIENPCYIAQDDGCETRYQYWGFIFKETDDNIMIQGIAKAIIETDRTPHEVVTWFKCHKGNISKKGVVYDAQRGSFVK